MADNCTSIDFAGDLLRALEAARIHLALAIAAESKSTPPDRWQHYLSTAERAGRFMRKLRKNGMEKPISSHEGNRALEALRRIPDATTAQRMCQMLGDIVAALE